MSANRGSTGLVDNLVFDFLILACDAILQERKGINKPITSSSVSFSDNADYCRQSLQLWRRELTKPLIMDIYIFDPKYNKHKLLERWKIQYQRNIDLKDSRQLSFINRRILTLIRSLYCFVRLLPGFYLTNVSSKPPILSFQLYELKTSYPSSFSSSTEISNYKFTPVSTSKGLISVSVVFITAQSVTVI